jgi:hypothetical protein
MKKIWFALTALISLGLTQAQNEVDALRYSLTSPGGTARSTALSGAFGALGADFSTLSTNPAGIGVYQGSEFTFTPSLYLGNTESGFLGGYGEDLKYNFNLGNAGLVFSIPTGPASKNKGWKSFQFGMGLNRLANFNNRILIEGFNAQSSLLDAYKDYAFGKRPGELDPFDTELAWNTWLLDTLSNSGTQYSSAVEGGNVTQRKSITSDGSINEFVLSMGANYRDKLYLGASLGFPFVRYFENSSYMEKDYDDYYPDFDEFNVFETLEARGSGVNFKLGMIYRAADWVRMGVALHTPTFYTMREDYNTTIASRFDNGDAYESSSPDGRFDYELETPMRAIGSIAFIVGKMGLISADYELVDYSSARLRSSTYRFFDENNAIRNSYTAAGNLRLGTEWRYENFSFRGGFAMYGSPYKNNLNDGERTSLSLGLGVREEGYFLDFAYIRTMYSEDYYLYDPARVPAALNDFTQQSFLMTLGLRF